MEFLSLIIPTIFLGFLFVVVSYKRYVKSKYADLLASGAGIAAYLNYKEYPFELTREVILKEILIEASKNGIEVDDRFIELVIKAIANVYETNTTVKSFSEAMTIKQLYYNSLMNT